MATSFLSYNFTSLHHAKTSKTSKTYAFDPLCHIAFMSKHNDKCSFAGNIGSLQSLRTYQRPASEKRLQRDLAVVYATPETTEGLLSFLPADNAWFAWVGGLLVAIPLAIKSLINFTNQVEVVAETVESVADTVGKIADEIDKAADEMVEKLPDGALKNMVEKIDDIAEATSDEAQKVEDLMDKVEEMSNKMEDFIEEKTQQTEKATSTTDKK